MSNCSTLTCLTISSQASWGMILSFACARARPASKSRYFWMRLPSDHTCRMASVPKMSLKMAESIVPVGMADLSDQWVQLHSKWTACGGGKRLRRLDARKLPGEPRDELFEIIEAVEARRSCHARR